MDHGCLNELQLKPLIESKEQKPFSVLRDNISYFLAFVNISYFVSFLCSRLAHLFSAQANAHMQPACPLVQPWRPLKKQTSGSRISEWCLLSSRIWYLPAESPPVGGRSIKHSQEVTGSKPSHVGVTCLKRTLVSPAVQKQTPLYLKLSAASVGFYWQ